MTYNNIAVYAHRGWASSAIVQALENSGAPITVLHRLGSDISMLAPSTKTIAVDIKDEAALRTALDGIDILISLVGQPDLALQHHMVAAIQGSSVKLFSPSDLSADFDEEGRQVPVVKAKIAAVDAARAAGIPTTAIWVNSFAESGLDAPLKGVNVSQNRITITGDSDIYPTNFCTRAYVAAAFASIFAQTPIAELANRSIALTELTPTSNDIIAALTERYGVPPAIKRSTVESLTPTIQSGTPLSLAAICRKIWATGKVPGMMGTDIWEVPGYRKATLHELIVEKKLVPYKTLPPPVLDALNAL